MICLDMFFNRQERMGGRSILYEFVHGGLSTTPLGVALRDFVLDDLFSTPQGNWGAKIMDCAPKSEPSLEPHADHQSHVEPKHQPFFQSTQRQGVRQTKALKCEAT